MLNWLLRGWLPSQKPMQLAISASMLELCAAGPIWAVIGVKLVRAICLLYGSDLHNLPVIDLYDNIVESNIGISLWLILSVLMAIAAYMIRRSRPCLALMLFMPQQFLVSYGALGFYWVLTHPHPEMPHSYAFIVADQIPQIAMAVSHAMAVIYAVSRNLVR